MTPSPSDRLGSNKIAMNRKQSRRESYISLSGGEVLDIGRQRLSISTASGSFKLENLYNGVEWVSPTLESDRFRDILYPNSRTSSPIVGPLFDEEETNERDLVITSLPPPPRRAGKKRSFKKPTPLRKASAARLRVSAASSASSPPAVPTSTGTVSRSSSRKKVEKPVDGVEGPKPAVVEKPSLQAFGGGNFASEPDSQLYTFLDDDEHVALTPTTSTPPSLDPIQISTPLSEHFSLLEGSDAEDEESDGSRYSQSQASTPVIPISPAPKGDPTAGDQQETLPIVVITDVASPDPESSLPGSPSIVVTGQHKRCSLSTVPKMGPVPPGKMARRDPAVTATGELSPCGDKTRMARVTSAENGVRERASHRQKQRPEMGSVPYGVAMSSKLLQATARSSGAAHADVHTKSGGSQSRSSLDSTTTSYYPSSTIDGASATRISISSTIYPDSIRTIHNSDNEDEDDDGASFIQIGSPIQESDNSHDYYNDYRNDDHDNFLREIQDEQTIDADNYQLMSILAGSRSSQQHQRTGSSPQPGQKPPLPTTPKPRFSRRALSPHSNSTPSSPVVKPQLVFEGYDASAPELPPTTNWLNQEERADLIRKSRKLARVFGRTPGPDVMAYQDGSRNGPQQQQPLSPHRRTPLSVSNDLDLNGGLRQRRRMSAWPSPTESQFPSVTTSRRHSAPLSPDDLSFLSTSSPLYEAGLSQVASQFRSNSHLQEQEQPRSNDQPTGRKAEKQEQSPHTSFIDLSDDETPHDDGMSILEDEATKKKNLAMAKRVSMSAQSLIENMTLEQQAEEERRRKRERLAKLHRHLGSRVPASLVLGVDHDSNSLPALNSSSPVDNNDENAAAKRKAWLRLRRRSSSAALPPTWASDLERSREELDTKEKALNVRRAQKMEKVFGVAPPQTLYHTRQPVVSTPAFLQPTAPKVSTPAAFMLPSSEISHFTRNPNQSSYQKGPRKSRHTRPGTSESSKALLPKGSTSPTITVNDGWNTRSIDDTVFDIKREARGSAIYNHYHHSMNSLNDILDRDDRESLVELRNYLNGDHDLDVDDSTQPLVGPFDDQHTPTNADVSFSPAETTLPRRPSNASSIKTERRLSLPTRVSLISLASEYSISSIINTPKPEVTDFELRRRRAAKLTQFFGVHYRELINDVLTSLENGLERERKRGTLQAEELNDLVHRLRMLKIKREGIF